METVGGLREAFGAVFRAHRVRAGISQEKLADSIGANRSYIYLIEKGGQNPALETLFHLAEGVGVPPEQLVAETRARFEENRK